MNPVKTPSSNFVWKGPTPDVGDLHAKVVQDPEYGTVTTTAWQPTDDELRFLLDGGLVELTVWGRHPVVALSVTGERSV